MSGKTKIDKVFIVLTPFHLKSFLKKYGSEIKNENVLILKEAYLRIEKMEDYNSSIITIPEKKFRIYDFFETPIKSLIDYKKQILEIRLFCVSLIEKINFNREMVINIGSDRDIFTQIFLNTIYQKLDLKIQLYAFDEGLGFYDNKGFLDKIKSFLFPIFSPILFGEKLYFNKPMGQDKRINEIFCRFPEFISKNGFSKYTKLEVRENENKGIYNSISTKALVFSFPLKDRDIPLSDKVRWLTAIYNTLEVNKFEIKLHPREEIFQLPDVPTVFFDGQSLVEDINYFDYKYIINFNSSIVMDLLSSGYPAEKIITVSFGAKLNLSSLYGQTQYLSIKEILNEGKRRF